MACDVSTIADQITGYYGFENRSVLLGLAGALSISSGLTATQAISGAAAQGYYSLEDGRIDEAILAALCVNSAASGTNIVPAGAVYSSDIGGGVGQLTISILNIGTSYTVVFGANDTRLANGFGNYVSGGPGDSQTFVASSATAFLFGIPLALVTATLTS